MNKICFIRKGAAVLRKLDNIFSTEFESNLILENTSKTSFIEKVISSKQIKLFNFFGTSSVDSSRLKTDAKRSLKASHIFWSPLSFSSIIHHLCWECVFLWNTSEFFVSFIWIPTFWTCNEYCLSISRDLLSWFVKMLTLDALFCRLADKCLFSKWMDKKDI